MNKLDVEFLQDEREAFLNIINTPGAVLISSDGSADIKDDGNNTIMVAIRDHSIPVYIGGIRAESEFAIVKSDDSSDHIIHIRSFDETRDEIVMVDMTIPYDKYLSIKSNEEACICTIENVPMHLLSYSPNMFYQFPIVELDSGIYGKLNKYGINSDAIPTYYTNVYAYFTPNSVEKTFITRIETDASESYMVHQSKVNEIYAKVKEVDWSLYRYGSALIDNRSGIHSNIYIIEDMNLSSVSLRVRSSFYDNEEIGSILQYRHSYVADEGVYLISDNSVIFAISNENDTLEIVPWINSSVLSRLGVDELTVIERVKAIYNAITGPLEINTDKVSELYDKINNGKRIDKNRNKTVKSLINLLNIQRTGMEALSDLTKVLEDDIIYIYDIIHNSKMLMVTVDEMDSLIGSTVNTLEDFHVL